MPWSGRYMPVDFWTEACQPSSFCLGQVYHGGLTHMERPCLCRKGSCKVQYDCMRLCCRAAAIVRACKHYAQAIHSSHVPNPHCKCPLRLFYQSTSIRVRLQPAYGDECNDKTGRIVLPFLHYNFVRFVKCSSMAPDIQLLTPDAPGPPMGVAAGLAAAAGGGGC